MIGASHSVPLAIAYERRGTPAIIENHRVAKVINVIY